MTKIKDLKIMILFAMALSIGACGGGSSAGTTETVTGLSTADNTQLLTE